MMMMMMMMMMMIDVIEFGHFYNQLEFANRMKTERSKCFYDVKSADEMSIEFTLHVSSAPRNAGDLFNSRHH